MIEKPKLIGSNLTDAVPQTGECKRDCGVNRGCECYGKGDRFYLPKDVPHMPTREEAKGKIVRVNSYHDSNDDKETVLRMVKGAGWDHYFFNTCVPNFDFPKSPHTLSLFLTKKPEISPLFSYPQAPVVYTCNGGPDNEWTPGGDLPPNVMFVRVRVNTWDILDQDLMIAEYLERKVPVVLTFLNYTDASFIPSKAWNDYEARVHVTNAYHRPKPSAMLAVMERYKGTGVRMCGTPWSSLCVDCRNCEFLYWDCLRRMDDRP